MVRVERARQPLEPVTPSEGLSSSTRRDKLKGWLHQRQAIRYEWSAPPLLASCRLQPDVGRRRISRYLRWCAARAPGPLPRGGQRVAQPHVHHPCTAPVRPGPRRGALVSAGNRTDTNRLGLIGGAYLANGGGGATGCVHTDLVPVFNSAIARVPVFWQPRELCHRRGHLGGLHPEAPWIRSLRACRGPARVNPLCDGAGVRVHDRASPAHRTTESRAHRNVARGTGTLSRSAAGA